MKTIDRLLILVVAVLLAVALWHIGDGLWHISRWRL